MAATFPGGVKVFTTKQAGDQIASAHINDLQDEVVAVETELRKTTGSVVSHGSLAGLTDDDHTQYVKDAGTVTDNAIVRFDGTDGRTIQNSKVTIDDNGIIKDENSNPYGRPVFLTTPLTSTSWDGDAYSTTAKTKIDLSDEFGVPAGVKAVLVYLISRDSGSAASQSIYFGLSPETSSGSTAVLSHTRGLPNDTMNYVTGICPCDSNGDIYYQINASGTETMDCWIRIWGYWL